MAQRLAEEAKDAQAPDVAHDFTGEAADLARRRERFARHREELVHLMTSTCNLDTTPSPLNAIRLE